MVVNYISTLGCILRRKDEQCRATVKVSPTDDEPSSTQFGVT